MHGGSGRLKPCDTQKLKIPRIVLRSQVHDNAKTKDYTTVSNQPLTIYDPFGETESHIVPIVVSLNLLLVHF